MTIDKVTAERLTERLSRFYATDHTAENYEQFIVSFFGNIFTRNIPLLDIPFYINSIQRVSIPKSFKSIWKTRGLSGSLDCPPEERIAKSADFFIRAKRDMLKLYSEMLITYLKKRNYHSYMITIKDVAHRLSLSTGEAEAILKDKNVPLYDIGGNIRLTEDDFAIFLGLCRIRSINIKSEIEVPWLEKEDESKSFTTKETERTSPNKGKTRFGESKKFMAADPKFVEKNKTEESKPQKKIDEEKSRVASVTALGTSLLDADGVTESANISHKEESHKTAEKKTTTVYEEKVETDKVEASTAQQDNSKEVPSPTIKKPKQEEKLDKEEKPIAPPEASEEKEKEADLPTGTTELATESTEKQAVEPTTNDSTTADASPDDGANDFFSSLLEEVKGNPNAEQGFEMGDNKFQDETHSPSSISYRNKGNE